MRVAAASVSSEEHQPARRLGSSEELRWSPLLRIFEQPAVAEEFETPATPDLLVVMVLRGSFRIESWANNRWGSAPYRPGTIGVTAPGWTDVLRWRGPDRGRRTTLHVHVPAELLEQTVDAVPSARRVTELNALDLVDPAAGVIITAMHVALRRCAEPLVADSLAQALAAQLLTTSKGTDHRVRSSARLSDKTLARVVDYMQAHLADPIGLEDLANEAHLSKYHFLRMFTATVGTTPHRYLTEMRMDRAADLLLSNGYTVTSIAALCGYTSTWRFTTLFRERYGATPGRFRKG